MCLLFLFFFTEGKEQPMEVLEVKRLEKKADFRISFKHLMVNEGFYSNHPLDKGRETYCGISRVFYPKWQGWKYIDEYKRHHKINWNDSIPVPLLSWHVTDHYLDIWLEEKFCDLKDQEIADYLFDFRINSPYANNITRKTLNEVDSLKLPEVGLMDSTTIAAINSCDRNRFMLTLLGNRAEFYTDIVIKNKSQIIFLKHWITRTKIKA